MSRSIEITSPPARTDQLLAEIRQFEGLTGLQVYRGASISPPGDVIVAGALTETLHEIVRLLMRHGAGRTEGLTFTTSEPTSSFAPLQQDAIVRDNSEATWEEMEFTIGKESNATANGLAMMFLGGAMATAGLVGSRIDFVIAAMIIAPGFESIARIGLAIGSTGRGWRWGLQDFALSYTALIAGALAGGMILRGMDIPLMTGTSSYLPHGSLLTHMVGFSATSLLSSVAAALAGAVLIAARRSVLTAGIMIALSLIPAASAIGLGIAAWQGDLVGRGALRWLVDVAIVLVGTTLVFAWKRRFTHKRRMLTQAG